MSTAKQHLIACEVFKDEFEATSPPDLARTYLPQGLHRTPGKMPAAIQEVLDAVGPAVESVLLGYGLCSNGIVGVVSRAAPLVMPRVHDCIALLLGSFLVSGMKKQQRSKSGSKPKTLSMN